MSGGSPIVYQWTGEAMVPSRAFRRRCDDLFCVGEHYKLDVIEERSAPAHRHYFAALHEAWMNLPERTAARFKSAEHLRKFALIRAGYCDERSIVCASKADAQRVAAWARPLDDYAVVVARDAIVIVYTAKSQSVRAMGNAEFQKSKDAVLEIVAGLIGTTPSTLAQAGEAA